MVVEVMSDDVSIQALQEKGHVLCLLKWRIFCAFDFMRLGTRVIDPATWGLRDDFFFAATLWSPTYCSCGLCQPPCACLIVNPSFGIMVAVDSAQESLMMVEQLSIVARRCLAAG